MAIVIEEKLVVYSTVSGETISPQHLWLGRDDIEAYLLKNKMPHDPNYSAEDLIYDITESEGAYTLDQKVLPATREYIAKMIEQLI